MCGIALLAHDAESLINSLASSESSKIWSNMCLVCADRGPDWSDSLDLEVECSKQQTKRIVSVYASVLHLRGSDDISFLTRQPHVGIDGSIFVWNGEIFEGVSVNNNENDGSRLFSQIQSGRGDTSALVDIMSQLEGPYAFILFNKPNQTLYFARDPLGRRSLLIHLPSPSEPFLALCSASNKSISNGFEELSTAGIFSVPLKTGSVFECTSRMAVSPRGTSIFAGQMSLNQEIPLDDSDAISAEQVEAFISRLDYSVKVRVLNIPSNRLSNVKSSKPKSRLGILFSGGIDCTILAFLADRHIPLDEPIDLLNVAFENPRALSAPNKNSIQEERAKRKRTKNQPRDDTSETETSASPAVGEVAEKPGAYDVPDRMTGLEEVEELRRLCPHRQWNFVSVDVPYEECKREEPKIIELMYPSKTVMDLSLALALYFASRGKGRVTSITGSSEGEEYVSSAKVLLSGLGSDELLGGYSRHKHAYNRGGWLALIDELQLDLDRLPTRNLGRDDRVISAHGRESRYPFLSLSLVSYLAQLPVHHKVDPRLAIQDAGMGDKTLLRLAAKRLGLTLASKRVKRAMQFGSRSARMEAKEAGRKGHVLLE